MVAAAPEVSVILPCYRAAARARRSVAEIECFLESSGRTWEIVVVDDGGGDFGSRPLSESATVRLVRLPRNLGKGAAVTAGILAARGRVRIFTDVDLPYGIELVPLLSELILQRGFHLVIGDRTMPGSTYGQELGFWRRMASAVFTAFVGRVVTGGFHDTQCGVKAIRGDVADALFPLLRIRRFSFDVELVYLALKYRADVKRVPVRLRRNDTSSVRLLRDSVQGVVDVLRIKLHQLRGHYGSSHLQAILDADLAATEASARGAWHRPRVTLPFARRAASLAHH